MVWPRKPGKKADLLGHFSTQRHRYGCRPSRGASGHRGCPCRAVDTAASVDAGSILSRATAEHAAGTDPAKKFKKFEAMVLQTFIQNMLPKDTEGVYGTGLAGDMWKSQLAERVADVMAERGGIGIAKSLLADHYLDGKRKVPIGPVSNGPEKTEIDQQTRLSTSLVQELQRKAARSMTGDETTIKTDTKI